MSCSLVQILNEYLDGNAKRTIQDLAMRAEVNEKTIRRILKGEIANPSLNTTLRLARTIFLGDESKVTNFMIECGFSDYEIQKKIRDLSSIDKDGSSHIVKRSTESIEWYRLTGFLTMQQGFHKSQILDEFGKWGLSTIEKLESDGMVETLASGKIRIKNGHIGDLDGKTVKNFVCSAASLFDPINYGSNTSQLGHMHRGIDEEGRWKIKQVLMEAVLKVICISNEHPGSIPVSIFTGMVNLSNSQSEGEIDA